MIAPPIRPALPRRSLSPIRAALSGLLGAFWCLVPLSTPALSQSPTEAPLPQESIVAGLSQNRVSITADFDGSEILVYGAVKRDGPVPAGRRMHVIVTAEGPTGPLVVRRKGRVAGIWINEDAATIESAPSFYAVATTGAVDEILSPSDNVEHSITVDQMVRTVEITDDADAQVPFTEALLRIYENDGSYRLLERSIQFTEQTLFRADITLPANLIEGDYLVRMFLLRDGKVIATERRNLWVRKEGLERAVYSLSHKEPLLYGLLSLLIAALAGWGASAGARLIRR